MNIEKYSKYKHFYFDDIPKMLAKYLKKHPFDCFLDAGCGDGSLLFALNEKRYLDKKTVLGIELSKERIRRCKKINPAFKLFCNNATNMHSVADNSVNFLVSTMVIEHVEDDEMMIREIVRVLDEKNNLVYLTTVFKKWYGWYYYRCNDKWTLDPTHLREYTSDSQLLNILRKYGFEIIETKKSLLWFSVAPLILRTIGGQNNIHGSFWKLINLFKIPIVGYYKWEIVCRYK